MSGSAPAQVVAGGHASTPPRRFPTLHRFVRERPLRVAGLVTLSYMAALAAWQLIDADVGGGRSDHRLLEHGVNATRVLLPAVALTVMGWWRPAGFLRRPTWSSTAPFLPLLVLPALPVLFGPGIVAGDGAGLAMLVLTMLAVGFGEEATFRGVVLRSLTSRGAKAAAAVSACMFGALHLVNLLQGRNVGDVVFQVLSTAGIGFGFAAAALVTGAIWPLVLIHTAMNLANGLQGATLAQAGAPAGADIANGLVNLALGALVAAYGYWLLQRRTRPG